MVFCHCGRTASYPTAPAQIPACGFYTTTSSEVLASARHSNHYGRRTHRIIALEATGDIWFHNPKLLNQLHKPGPIVAAALAASVQIFHQQPHRFVKEQHQDGEIVSCSIIIEIASELGIQLLEQLWQPYVPVRLAPLIEAFQRVSQVLAGCVALRAVCLYGLSPSDTQIPGSQNWFCLVCLLG